jgi:hypothetical protein
MKRSRNLSYFCFLIVMFGSVFGSDRELDGVQKLSDLEDVRHWQAQDKKKPKKKGTQTKPKKNAEKKKKEKGLDWKNGSVHDFPLGPVGGLARIFAGDDFATVRKVNEGQPGYLGGLKVEDKIVAVNGRGFEKYSKDINLGGQGIQEVLGAAIEKVEGDKKKKGALRLTVIRGGKKRELKLKLPLVGSFAKSFPFKCKKSLKFYEGVCFDLAKTQEKNGRWRSNAGKGSDRYVTALCGLALLGRGEARYVRNVRPAVHYLMQQDGLHFGKNKKYKSEYKEGSNWVMAVTGMLLAEWSLATKDKTVLPCLQNICDLLNEYQSKDGKYRHSGPALKGAGYNDRGLNIINTQAHLTWALAKEAGCKIDKAGWKLSYKQVKKSIGKNGGVRYWSSQTGYGDASARTGSMALALYLTKQDRPAASAMGLYLAKASKRMRHAHAMSSIGMIFGALALHNVNPAGYRQHMNYWKWYLNLSRQTDYSAEYISSKRNSGGDHYLGKPHCANAISGLMLAPALKKLWLCGNRKKGWLRKKGS